MSVFEKQLHARGHLIDSQLLAQVMDVIIRAGATFRILDLKVGRTNEEESTIDLVVSAPSAAALQRLLEQLSDVGFVAREPKAARFESAPSDGVVPEDFYSTTHHETEVLLSTAAATTGWQHVADQRMDACIVLATGVAPGDAPRLCCRKLRDVRRGELVLVGLDGVRVVPEWKPRDRSDDAFTFMSSAVSSERQVRLAVERVADLIRATRARGARVIWVPGPVMIHTGAGRDFAALVEAGFVGGVLSGNALAVHDIEHALFRTSLGISLEDGHVTHLGHRNHMRAINAVRTAGSIEAAVANGIIREGICHALVRHRVPFVLAGSIRDDGPLPDTEMNLLVAQERYAALLKDAGLVIVLASMLHGIGVGNMLPGHVPLVCVDIHSAVVTKLADRGSAQTHGIVTDVGLFLGLLRAQLLAK
ncbi:MAG: TIGR00300 family protein [Planctomycetota bacterium]